MLFTRVVVAMVVAVLCRAAVQSAFGTAALYEEVHGIAAYLGVLGGLYSIIVAFLIYVVWDQYNRVQIGVSQEAAAVEDLCRVAAFLSERDAARGIRHAALRYIETTSGDELRQLAQGRLSALAEEHYGALCSAVRGIDVKTEKDGVIYEELLRSVTRISDARDARLGVSATRIPGTLWSLILFASSSLLGGFLVLGVSSAVLSGAVVAAVAGTLTFLLSVVKDMDNPFAGLWNVSYAPMTSIAARIAQK